MIVKLLLFLNQQNHYVTFTKNLTDAIRKLKNGNIASSTGKIFPDEASVFIFIN